MVSRRLYLTHGTEPGHVADALRGLINDARNIIPSVAGGHRVMRLRDKYIDWVEGAELQLSNFTIQPEMNPKDRASPASCPLVEVRESEPTPRCAKALNPAGRHTGRQPDRPDPMR